MSLFAVRVENFVAVKAELRTDLTYIRHVSSFGDRAFVLQKGADNK